MLSIELLGVRIGVNVQLDLAASRGVRDGVAEQLATRSLDMAVGDIRRRLVGRHAQPNS
jgi:hypothetical protein